MIHETHQFRPTWFDPVIVVRLKDGVRNHFPMRVTEWIMVWPCLWMGAALNWQPTMFDTSASYSSLASWLDERQWALIVLCCAIVRLVALIVNGTFQAFPYSPHLRILASAVSAMFWFQFSLGFTLSAFAGGGLSAVAAYSTFVLLEGVNVVRASEDLGRGRTWRR
ncbi:hypothetical protein Q4543_17550 [Salipiger sp. 1_MG-2023]|uniref:hypothetical protein n=1 Tax=Salipiger sp. 1_MG-2023 TaxID=3062665 RepID=UPI0026E425A4|nr:hypothetical protein [Salipiger sp. 1_MG-2023]MDO6587320.1 hypothetical protein [Salipiger sp. 1_MG-2023]